MRNKFFGWVSGRARETIGVYWGSLGVCLARRVPAGKTKVVYVPGGKDTESLAWEEAVLKLEALSGVKRSQLALAVALSADDVFTRTVTAPEGLDERQLEQVAIVEAIVNLPVPPEEICLDFLRKRRDGQDELVKLAYCRRERIDQILLNAEEVAVPVHVVDRDVQAIHDVISEQVQAECEEIAYPFGIVLTEVSPKFVICTAPTDFEVYPIRMQIEGDETLVENLVNQLANCWTRCKMSRPMATENINHTYVVGSAIEPRDLLLAKKSAVLGGEMVRFFSDLHQDKATASEYVPEEITLIAIGMAGRLLT